MFLAYCWFEIILFSMADLSRVANVSDRAHVTATPANLFKCIAEVFLSKHL